MEIAAQATLDSLKEFGTAAVFNSIRSVMGGGPEGEGLESQGGVPVNYMDLTMRCVLPELGVAVGYAFTATVTTSDPDSESLPWDGYYELMEQTPGPKIIVIKDIDSKAGRGSSIGDTMAAQHKMLGGTAMVVDGTVRDIVGIRKVGLPIWGWGSVSGHGLFHLVGYDQFVVASGLLVHPGDLMVADVDGVLRIPHGIDLDALVEAMRDEARKEQELHALYRKPGTTYREIGEFIKRTF